MPEATHAQSPALSGQVRYYSNAAAVPDVVVELSGTGQSAATTDAGGAYEFVSAGTGNWTIEPRKTGELNGAVSTLDATHALQTVVGSRGFSDAQRIACDVTGDGTVSALDASRIMQLVAGSLQRLPVAQACGSDWAFLPNPDSAANQRLIAHRMGAPCAPGAIAYEPLSPPATGQDFVAVLFGDCTGNWQSAAPPRTATPRLTATPSHTASPVATSTRTLSPTRTRTPTATETSTPPPTRTFTPTYTRTPTRSSTPTRTRTSTVAPPSTITATPTRTGTRTQTPTLTFSATPTPTTPCANGAAWGISAPRLVSQQTGGEIWLARTVPTDSGWGIFWLRVDPDNSRLARLYYAHVDFNAQITVVPKLIASIPKIAFRAHYYMVAWNAGRYALLTAENSSLYYHNMTLDGALSGRHVVGPPLFVDPQFDQESDGDLDAFPGGFMGVVEGECAGHSCAYAFKLDTNGSPTSAVTNLVDFDLTHQFYPASAFDGSGFALLSVKDITIANGGVMTKYWPLSGIISGHKKVVQAKEYKWDEFPDIAWNGNHFAAIWTENSARSHSAPWQINFATFRRTSQASTLIANRVIDIAQQKTGHRWSTQVHPMGIDWVAQYASRGANGNVVAVYELLGADAQTGLVLEPFELSADALGSSPHFAAPRAGVLGIARGSYGPGVTNVEFYTLEPPACQ